MTDSYRALANDAYVNMKLQVKMELPRTRETVLDFFERMRRTNPDLSAFRKAREEYSLESPPGPESRWIAVRSNSVRSGMVNPASFEDAYSLHAEVLETAPAFLSIPPLDVEYVELLFGFDILAGGQHDGIVFEALCAGSPLAGLGGIPGATPVDFQPLVGLSLRSTQGEEVQAHFEIKTHPHSGRRESESTPQPICMYLTLRRFGTLSDIRELPRILRDLAVHGEGLLESRLIPHVLIPIRQAAGMGHS